MGIISLFNSKDLNDSFEGIKNPELRKEILSRQQILDLSENKADQLEEILGLKKNEPSVKVEDNNIINLNQQEFNKHNDPETNRIIGIRKELDHLYGEAA